MQKKKRTIFKIFPKLQHLGIATTDPVTTDPTTTDPTTTDPTTTDPHVFTLGSIVALSPQISDN